MDPGLEMSAGELLFERRGVERQIGWVTFNRPQARNALTFAMYEGVAQVAAEADRDRSLRVLVFCGAGGRAFAAGTDISQFRAFRTPEDALEYEQRMDRVLDALESVRVPTIAAIQGACTGGGAGIAAACDLRLSSPSGRFGIPIARTLGNTVSIGNLARLTALLGLGRVKDLIFTARLVEAPEAQTMGLIHEVAAGDAFEARVAELAQAVASYAPLTLRATKEALRRMRERTIPDGSDLMTMCYGSADFKEGVTAFLEKRAPRWQGR